MTDLEITRVGNAHFVYTPLVNWVILVGDDGVTLIDGGYPGQAGLVEESLRRVGAQPGDIKAALLTHAHVDHLGGLAKVAQRHGFPVYADPAEVGHARRDFLHQANALTLAPYLWRPRVLLWLSQMLPQGGLSRRGIPATQPFPALDDDGALPLPGRPVPVTAHGHTDGHSGYLVADGQVLVSGDALITGHLVTAEVGPQELPAAFTHDPEAARAPLAAFAELDAQVLFPGHGPVQHGPVAEAARTVLARR